jgi:hypothetical protein
MSVHCSPSFSSRTCRRPAAPIRKNDQSPRLGHAPVRSHTFHLKPRPWWARRFVVSVVAAANAPSLAKGCDRHAQLHLTGAALSGDRSSEKIIYLLIKHLADFFAHLRSPPFYPNVGIAFCPSRSDAPKFLTRRNVNLCKQTSSNPCRIAALRPAQPTPPGHLDLPNRDALTPKPTSPRLLTTWSVTLLRFSPNLRIQRRVGRPFLAARRLSSRR